MFQLDAHIYIAISLLRAASHGTYQPQRFNAITFGLIVLVLAQHFNNVFRILHACHDIYVMINIPQNYFFRLAHEAMGAQKDYGSDGAAAT